MREAHRARITIDGMSCSYTHTGAGKPLIFLHGWAQSLETWNGLIGDFAEYAVYAPDMPGFGESDAPSRAWAIANYADWVHEFIEKLGLEGIVVIGHSFGARVAVEYAKQYPLQKLVIIATGGSPRHSWFRALNKLLVTIFRPFTPTLLYRVHAHMLTPRGYAQSNVIERSRALAMLAIYDTTHVPNEALFLDIRCPTLLIYGDRDWIAPLRAGKVAHASIQESKLVVLNGAGHFPHITHARQTTRSISQFLEGTINQ